MSRNLPTTDFIVTVAFFSCKSLKGTAAKVADKLDLDWFSGIHEVPGWGLLFEKEIEAPHLEKTIEEMLEKTLLVKSELEEYEIHAIQLGIVPYISSQTNPGVAISDKALRLLMDVAEDNIKVNIDIDIYLSGD